MPVNVLEGDRSKDQVDTKDGRGNAHGSGIFTAIPAITNGKYGELNTKLSAPTSVNF